MTTAHTQHTAGPWEIDEGTGHIVPKGGVGGGIADVWGDNPEQQTANAHLIAAAPDLYAACEKLLGMYESMVQSEYEGTSMFQEMLAEADDARAALAKARGEQPAKEAKQ